MKTITLKSGNTFDVQAADFPIAWKLTQAIAGELGSSLATLTKIPKVDMKSLLNQEMSDIGPLLGAVMKLVANENVYRLLWPCFVPCIYNGQKVVPTTFNSIESRPDFLPCVVELLKENVFPFIAGLDLASSTESVPSTAAPK